MNTWGNRLRLTIFGSSHGPEVGLHVDGLPPGIAVDIGSIRALLARRAPGGPLDSPRCEPDLPRLPCGVGADGLSDGSRLTIVIDNRDVDGSAYGQGLCRPGHADYPAYVKYGSAWDYAGGGQFSGRMTAPLTAFGAIAKDWLAQRGIAVEARLSAVAGITEPERWPELLAQARQDGDSLGGLAECTVRGLPVGVGEPFFASCEAVLSSLLFSVPGVKGVEFGDGFALAGARGSQAADAYGVEAVLGERRVRLLSNHNGGLLGGLSNGAELVLRAAFKPTPSLNGGKKLLDLTTMTLVQPQRPGRHDPCIARRGAVVVEAVTAISLMELMI